uniref:Uncharacterized protein n=1 Tax=Aegilops tauschii TaxID=37682 RepID=M8AZU0_AEGTA
MAAHAGTTEEMWRSSFLQFVLMNIRPGSSVLFKLLGGYVLVLMSVSDNTYGTMCRVVLND